MRVTDAPSFAAGGRIILLDVLMRSAGMVSKKKKTIKHSILSQRERGLLTVEPTSDRTYAIIYAIQGAMAMMVRMGMQIYV